MREEKKKNLNGTESECGEAEKDPAMKDSKDKKRNYETWKSSSTERDRTSIGSDGVNVSTNSVVHDASQPASNISGHLAGDETGTLPVFTDFWGDFFLHYYNNGSVWKWTWTQRPYTLLLAEFRAVVSTTDGDSAMQVHTSVSEQRL